MFTKEAVFAVIFSAIEEYNAYHPVEEQLEKTPTTILVGEMSPLTSLGLITLIVAVEQKLDENLQVKASLLDELLERMGENTLDVEGLAQHIVNLQFR